MIPTIGNGMEKTMFSDDFFVLDFEASGLDWKDSYPIQAGYTDGILKRCMLIKPMAHWWHWNDDSEKIHKIPRHVIDMTGENVVDVCNQMNEDLQGKQVWCDSMAHDEMWCNKLFCDAGVERKFNLLYYRTFGMMDKETITHDALEDAIQIREHMIRAEF